jgi:hypothetical protein
MNFPASVRRRVEGAPQFLTLPTDLLVNVLSDSLLPAVSCYQLRYVCKTLQKWVDKKWAALGTIALPPSPEDLPNVRGIYPPQGHWWLPAASVVRELTANVCFKDANPQTCMLIQLCVGASTTSDGLWLKVLCFFLCRVKTERSHMGYYKSLVVFGGDHCFRHFRFAEQCIQFGSGMFVHELIRRKVFPSYSAFFVHLTRALTETESPFEWTTADVAHLIWAVEVTVEEVEYTEDDAPEAAAEDRDLPGPWAAASGQWRVGEQRSIMDVLVALNKSCPANVHGVIAEMIALEGWVCGEVAYAEISQEIQELFKRLVQRELITRKTLPAVGAGMLRHVDVAYADEYSPSSCDVRDTMVVYARLYADLVKDDYHSINCPVRSLLYMTTSGDDEAMKVHFAMLFRLYMFSHDQTSALFDPIVNMDIDLTETFTGLIDGKGGLVARVADVVGDILLDYYYGDRDPRDGRPRRPHRMVDHIDHEKYAKPLLYAVRQAIQRAVAGETLADDVRGTMCVRASRKCGGFKKMCARAGIFDCKKLEKLKKVVKQMCEEQLGLNNEADGCSRLITVGICIMETIHTEILATDRWTGRWGGAAESVCRHRPQYDNGLTCSSKRRRSKRMDFAAATGRYPDRIVPESLSEVETWCFKPECTGRERQQRRLYEGCEFLHRIGLLMQHHLGLPITKV